jgi:hypothetical protein
VPEDLATGPLRFWGGLALPPLWWRMVETGRNAVDEFPYDAERDVPGKRQEQQPDHGCCPQYPAGQRAI